MPVPRLILLEFVGRLGKPGLAGALLLAAALAYGAFAVLPAREEANRLQDRVGRAEAALARQPAIRQVALADNGQEGGQEGGSPIRKLPTQAEVTRWVEHIYALASEEWLALARGEYVLAGVADTRLVRYQIFLPVKGDYLSIRRFVAAAQAQVPGLGLEDLSLQRQNIGDAQAEALIRFSLYLAKP